MNHQKHYGAAILAFMMWGFFTIPLRQLIQYPAGEILYFRILFSAVILLIVIALFRRKELKRNLQIYQSLARRDQWVAVLLTLSGGALLTVNWLTFIYIVNHVSIKTASFSYLICPVMTAVLGYVLIKEKLNTQQWIAVALCGISCLVMGMDSLSELGYSVLTALTYALYLITQRKNQGFDRILVLTIQIVFALLVLTTCYGKLVPSAPAMEGDLYFYEMILLIAVVFTIIPLFLNLFALNKINSATIGILMYINPLLNFTIAFLVFHEAVTNLQLVGYAVIAFALIIFNYHHIGRIRELTTKS